MMQKLKYSIIFLMLQVVLLTLTGCHGGGTAIVSGDDVALKYAELLTLTKSDKGYVVAEIKNPWSKVDSTGSPTGVLQQYVIEKPLKRVVVYTSVHASLINEIGAFKAICGVCDANFMYLDKVQEGIKDGTIADCGEGMTPNIEKIMDLQPDAILLSPFENSGTYGKLGKIGIPLIQCADYMENSPLGRAEWMRFYGLLFGCEDKADSLFSSVETNYNNLAKQVDSLSLLRGEGQGREAFTEKKTGDTWYVAGNDSYVGRLIADAGGKYVFEDVKGAGSQPYNPEKVFDRAQNADIWLLKYSQDTPMTLSQLADEWGAYKSLKAYKNKSVWGCNLSKSMFYEETPFHPDLFLKDFVKILHPDILKDYTLRYYKKIEASIP